MFGRLSIEDLAKLPVNPLSKTPEGLTVLDWGGNIIDQFFDACDHDHSFDIEENDRYREARSLIKAVYQGIRDGDTIASQSDNINKVNGLLEDFIQSMKKGS